MITYQELKGHTDQITLICLDQSNRQYLLSTSIKQLFIVWDLNNFNPIHNKIIDSYFPKAIAIQFPYIAYTKGSGCVEVQNIIDSKTFQTKQYKDSFLLCFYKQSLIQGCYDNKVYISNYRQGIIVRIIDLEPVQEFKQNILNPRQFVFINFAGQVRYIDIETSKTLQRYKISGCYSIDWKNNTNFSVLVKSGPKHKLYMLNSKNKIIRTYESKEQKISIISLEVNYILFQTNRKLYKLNIMDFKEQFVIDLQPTEQIEKLSDEYIFKIDHNKLYKMNFI